MDNKVERTIISPANFELLPIASAITKDATAVGLANKIKRITICSELKFIDMPKRTAIKGNRTILLKVAIKESFDAFFKALKFKDPPILTKANGNAILARYVKVIVKICPRLTWKIEKGVAKKAAIINGFFPTSTIVCK